jgi:hypothetical protein
MSRSGRTLVRLDRPFEPQDQEQADREGAKAAAPEGGSLLDRLRDAIFATRCDRRGLVRHAVVDHDVWLGWWAGDAFGAVLARLENLSRGGALVTLAERPPRREPVWLYKELGTTLALVRGDVVGIQPAPGGLYAVRIAFVTPCPTDLCQATICGPRGSGRGEPRRQT